MNPPKCDDLDYIHFLIAAQKVFTCTEAARCAPEEERAPAHDAFARLLQRQPPDTEALWQEAKAFVDVGKGLLVLDDTTLDKPYAQKMDLVTYHWSGKHRRVVKGIALLTLLWTEGKALIPCDLGLTQLAGRDPHIWRVIGQNTPYMAVRMTQLGPNCVTPTTFGCMTSPRAGRPKTSTFKRCCGKLGSGVLGRSMC
jgi:hypothetical protein